MNFSFQQQTDGCHFYFKGDLTRETLFPLLSSPATEIGKNAHFLPPFHWHFEALSSLDSAGFALLCDFLHQGEKYKVEQSFSCNEQFLILAELFGLKNYLMTFLKQ